MLNDPRRNYDEALLRAALESAPLAMVMVDDAGWIVLANKFVKDVFGYDDAELLGQSIEILLPARFRDHHGTLRERFGDAPVPRLMGAGQPLYGMRKDGTEFPVEVGLSPVKTRIGNFVIGAIVDITERNRIANALQESEQRFRDFAEIASDSLWEMDPENRFTFASADLRSDDQGGADPIIGKTPWEAFGADPSEPNWQAFIEATRARREFRGFENELIDPSGNEVAFSVSGRPRYDRNGDFLGYRGTVTNITERKRTEKRQHAVQKFEAIGQMTGGIAHDFNNFLTVVLGNLDFILERDDLDPELKELIENTYRASLRGAELTRQLLAYSRQQILQPTPTNLNDALRAIVPMIGRTIGEQYRVVFEPAEVDLWASIDSSLFESAVLNLCVNARDAMPELGGYLCIESAEAFLDDEYSTGQVEVQAGQYALVSITDTGSGMPPEIQARALEPFFTTKELGKGTGLGLSMVFGFVKQSGGHLSIYSEPGHGTTVKMYFPLLRAPYNAARSADAQHTLPRIAANVVLVEDDDNVRKIVLLMLERLGCRVEVAPNGPAAVELIDRLDGVDLLMTDVVMPGGMSGVDLAKTVRETRPDLKILFSSGYAEASSKRQIDAIENVAWISKPYNTYTLGAKLRALLAD